MEATLADNVRGYYTPIQGTWAWKDIPLNAPQQIAGKHPQWWEQSSKWSQFLEQHGYYQHSPDDPFIWSTEIGGLFWMKRNMRSWMAAGNNLRQWMSLRGIALLDRNVVSHSHGAQVVAFAAASGLKLNTVISVAPPFRKGVPYDRLIAQCERWLVIEDPGFDFTAALGELFDGRIFPGHAPHDPKVTVIKSPGIQHSRVLNEPAFIDRWHSELWMDWLAEPPVAVPPAA